MAFKAFAVISMFSPILGMTSFWAGGFFGRGYRDYDFGSSTENMIAVVTFSIAALCQLVHIAGWVRLGRRSVESDLIRAGAVAVCSILTLIQLWARPGQLEGGSVTIVVLAALVVSLIGLLLFLVAGSTAPFPDVDLTALSDDDRNTLLAQRAAALTKLAERKLIKIRQANKATERPLGSLVGRRIE
ncbi:hypothetical protein FB381_2295 [Nocardioides albertanoniae]|uniref:Uncharacterized protein n=2 Tax=Nocardioides albertanoniae TaxID=1175486 RepID=A0A543A7F7_9ACTN|nr:hypothetical protein FB381_2295 [Nocardioides albertanoniae]